MNAINAAFLNAFFIGLSTAFQQGLSGAESYWNKVAMLIPSATSENLYPWLKELPGFREWVGDKVISALEIEGYRLTNKDFEATISVKRSQLEDDQSGTFAPMVRQHGYAAKVWPDEGVFGALRNGFTGLCFDGKPFFSTDHPVGEVGVSNVINGAKTPWYLLCTKMPLRPLIFQQRKAPTFVQQTDPQSDSVFKRGEFLYGAEARGAFGYGFWQLAVAGKTDLTAENYAAARAKMTGLKDAFGRPLNIQPNLLVVPSTLEGAGRKLLVNQLGDSGETNEWFNTAELLVSGWVDA
jgi:phage major head subunit gpT-like protein